MTSLKAIKSCIKFRPMKAFSKLLLLAVGLTFAIGCATTEEDNLSERPWNAPKSWESGLPQQMMQGR